MERSPPLGPLRGRHASYDLRAVTPSSHPLSAIGSEIQGAFIALGGIAGVGADNGFWRQKCGGLLVRPAVEPLVLAHWTKLTGFAMSEPELAGLCSLMSGSKQVARTRNSRGLWSGGDVRFEAPEQARFWWANIQAVSKNRALDALLPAYCFARTIIAHPYPDGNGLLARALVHAALARTTDYRAPFLPLAPVFYMNGTKVADALHQLSETGDWDAFNAVFTYLLRDAASLAKRV